MSKEDEEADDLYEEGRQAARSEWGSGSERWIPAHPGLPYSSGYNAAWDELDGSKAVELAQALRESIRTIQGMADSEWPGPLVRDRVQSFTDIYNKHCGTSPALEPYRE